MSKVFQLSCALIALSATSLVASNEEIAGTTCCKKKEMCEEKKPVCPCPPVCAPCAPMLPSLPCPDTWRASGEYLYLLPTFDDTYFVFNSGVSTTFPNGKRENNDFDFKSGFRVGLEYAMCPTHREVAAYYTHLSAHQEKTVSGSHLWATVGRPDQVSSFENFAGTAASRLGILYQRGDLVFSQQAISSCGMYFYIEPSLEYAYLRLDEHYDYQKATAHGSTHQKSRTWGVGPQIGLGLDYNFYEGTCNCNMTHAFSITSLFSGSILVGRAKTNNHQVLAASNLLNISDEHTWRTIPALHARVGLNYMVNGSWMGASVGVGYELNTYLRAVGRTQFPDDVADGLCTTNYYNFDVQGLYVSGAFTF